MIEVNLTGTFHCIQSAIPDMIAAGGWIVTISSSSAQSGANRMSHYVAVRKAAWWGSPRRWRSSTWPSGITVNTIPPGFIDTPMARGPAAWLTCRPSTRSRRALRCGARERRRDIAAACQFLCSDDVGYITGQLIGVNGGWVRMSEADSPRLAPDPAG